jgi:hypothetical protein
MPHVDTPTSRCRIGVARCDITPPVGIYHRMWGAAIHDRSTGIHQPLTATALVFQALDAPPGPETEQVLVAVDHCLLGAQEMGGVRDAISTAAELAREQVVVVFSHTHGAGLMNRDRAALPGGERIPPYLEELGVRLGRIVEEARRSVEPVIITYGTGRCSLAAHRDFWDKASGQYVCGFNPDGPADDTVLVARITGADGGLRATVVNYACHPTTLAWQNTLISPDYPGFTRAVVEQATGVTCVFLQGAAGDVGPRHGFVGDPEVAERNGRQLGYAALAALEGLPPPATRFRYEGPVISGATLGIWSHVPLEKEELQNKARWRLRRWTLELPYRPDLATCAQTEAELRRWQTEEQAARAAGDTTRVRDCRAMVERQTRQLGRLRQLPAGERFPLPLALWKVGDAFWLAVEGELYNVFQRGLRAQFAGVPVVVMTLANGSRPTYLPTADTYGKGIYQESIALLARGSLEQVLAIVRKEIAFWLPK